MEGKHSHQARLNEAWLRIKQKFHSAYEKLADLMSAFLPIIVRGFNGPIILVTVIFFSLVMVETFRYEDIIIDPILMPQGIVNIGYTPDIAADRIIDSSNKYDAGFKYREKVYLGNSSHELDKIMPTVGIPIRPVARYLRDLFNVDVTTITGEILHHKSENRVSIHLRKDSTLIFNYSSKLNEQGMNELFDKSGYELAKITDPFALAIYHYNRNEYTEAEDVVKIIFGWSDKNEDDHVQAVNLYGVLLYINGQYDEAIVEYKRAITLAPTFIAPYNNWAAALVKKDDYPGAVEKYKKAIKLDRENVTTYVFWCGAILEQENPDLDSAIKKCEKALELDKENIYAYINLGAALMLKRDYPRAIDNYMIAMELDPENATTYVNLGKLLAISEKPDYPGAIEKYKEAITLDSDNIDAYLYWGFALAMKDNPDLDGAIEKFKKVITIDPRHANAYVNWGHMLAIKKEPDYPGAIEKYKRAIELDPNNINAYQEWAYTLAIKGDFINAAKLYECANILDSGKEINVCP